MDRIWALELGLSCVGVSGGEWDCSEDERTERVYFMVMVKI